MTFIFKNLIKEILKVDVSFLVHSNMIRVCLCVSVTKRES